MLSPSRMKSSLALLALASVVGACQKGKDIAANETPLVRPYLDMAAQLSEDRADQLPALAQELAAAAKAEGDKPGLAQVIAASASIGGELEPSRKAFKKLSDGMIEYMRAVPATEAGTVIVHCPMAFGDQGAQWVQREGKVANPYFGASMLRCGDKLAWDAELPKTAQL